MKISHSVSVVLSLASHGEPTGCRLGSFDAIIASKREISHLRWFWDRQTTPEQYWNELDGVIGFSSEEQSRPLQIAWTTFQLG